MASDKFHASPDLRQVVSLLSFRESLVEALTPCSQLRDKTPQPAVICGRIDVVGWGAVLTPYLRAVLSSESQFSNEQIDQHCVFFARHVVPWLGASGSIASHHGRLERNGPISRLTKDGTPLEFSVVWKESSPGRTSAVRYVVDITTQESGSLRSQSLHRALAALENFYLLALSQESSLRLITFWDIWKAVTTQMLDFDRSKHGDRPCARCSASAMYLGFELQASTVMLKPYWLLPTCASTEELLQLIDRVIGECGSFDDFYRSDQFLAEWSKIRKHISHQDGGRSYLHPCLISIDTTKAPAQRLKVYTRCIFQGFVDFEHWSHHLDASGTIAIHSSFLEAFKNVWNSLCAPGEDWSPEERQTNPHFSWVQFEFHPTTKTQSKIYIMCPEIPRPDNYTAKALLKHCELLKGSRFIKSLASTTDPTDFATVVAIKPGQAIAEVTLYFTPAIFARSEWISRYRTNGFFTKVRNKAYTATTL